WFEVGILRREVQVVHSSRQVPRNLELAFDEGLVDDHLGRDRAQLRLPPRFYLLSHGLEVPLHPVNTDRDGVYKRKALRVFGQDGLKVTAESHIRANRDPISTGQSEAHTLVVAVAQTNREAAAMHFRFKIQDAEHLHSIR